MALPNSKDSYETYTERLVYLSARLALDPRTRALATRIDEVLTSVDEAHQHLLEARRAEIRARALRDYRDELGEVEIKKYQRRLALARDVGFFVRRLFPTGASHTAGGRQQLERLEQLRTQTDELLASVHLATHPEAAELRIALEHGRGVLDEAITELREVVAAWEARSLELVRAWNAYDCRRAEGVARVRAIFAELQDLVGGRAAEAHAVAWRQLDPDVEAMIAAEPGETTAPFDEAG